jgi:hypothetical protein
MGNSVSNYVDRQPLGIRDRFFNCRAVAHHSRKFQRFSDPAPVDFALDFDRYLQVSILRFFKGVDP